MQEAFVRMWERRWDRVGTLDEPVGYLFKTALNLHRSVLRRAVAATKRSVRPPAEHDPFEKVIDHDEAVRSLAALTLGSEPPSSSRSFSATAPRRRARSSGSGRARCARSPRRHERHSRNGRNARMSDLKALLEHAERAVSVVPLPPDGLDGLQRRRDRKRRNQRLSAGFVGIAVFVSAVGIVTTGMPFDRTETPAVPSAAGSGAALDPFISINAQLSGDQPVDLFKVKTSDPQYWRLYTLDVYDGEEWRSSDPDGSVGGQSVSVPTVLPQAPAYTPRTPRPSRSRSRSSATSTRRTRCRWRSRRRRSPPEASAT